MRIVGVRATIKLMLSSSYLKKTLRLGQYLSIGLESDESLVVELE